MELSIGLKEDNVLLKSEPVPPSFTRFLRFILLEQSSGPTDVTDTQKYDT